MKTLFIMLLFSSPNVPPHAFPHAFQTPQECEQAGPHIVAGHHAQNPKAHTLSFECVGPIQYEVPAQ